MACEMSTPVLLGVADEEVRGRDTDWSVSKIGGQPDWCVSGVIVPPCGHCGGPRSQMCQVYCPLEGSPYHRTLHLLACCQPGCWNRSDSWCVIRCQYLEDNTTHDTKPSSDGIDWGVDSSDWADEGSTSSALAMATDWCDDADDWGDDDDDDDNCASSKDPLGSFELTQSSSSELSRSSQGNTDDSAVAVASAEESVIQGLSEMTVEEPSDDTQCIAEPLHTEAEYMTQLLSSHPQTSDSSAAANPLATELPTDSSGPTGVVLNSYFINVLAEPSAEEDSSSRHVNKLLKDYVRREGVQLEDILTAMPSGKGKGGGGESYEKAQVQHGDRLFHKFNKQLARCPQQIMRYSWNGVPLLLRNLDKTSIPHCNNCGTLCAFEMQLMPGLVSLLKTPTGESAVEFGTVLVYSCQASCWDTQTKHRMENIIVQADPDQHLFKS